MNKQVRPQGIKARPFDFFVAFLVFFIGVYGFFDPNWPEKFDPSVAMIILIEDIYLSVAGLTIMISVIANEILRRKFNPRIFATSIIIQMFGWLFISVAAWAIALTTPVVPPSIFAGEEGVTLWGWAILWAGLGASSWLRYRYIRLMTRSRIYE